MERRREIVEAFLKAEKLLTPRALSFLEKTKDYRAFLKVKREKLVLDIEDFATFETQVDRVKILLNITSLPTQLEVRDFARFYRDRYEKLRDIIVKRIEGDYISIDKLGGEEKLLVVMVREIREQNDKVLLEVEDLTGKCSVLVDKETAKEVERDDVIAIRCRKFGDLAYATVIMYPDVPIRKPKTGRGKLLIVSDLHLDEAPIEQARKLVSWFINSDVKFLLIAGDIGDLKALESLLSDVPREKTVFFIPGEIDDKRYPAPPMETRNSVLVPLSN
ncbi:MAG: hypothetical protein DRJ03_29515, partial [Chloroflexi bacterium]